MGSIEYILKLEFKSKLKEDTPDNTYIVTYLQREKEKRIHKKGISKEKNPQFQKDGKINE